MTRTFWMWLSTVDRERKTFVLVLLIFAGRRDCSRKPDGTQQRHRSSFGATRNGEVDSKSDEEPIKIRRSLWLICDFHWAPDVKALYALCTVFRLRCIPCLSISLSLRFSVYYQSTSAKMSFFQKIPRDNHCLKNVFTWSGVHFKCCPFVSQFRRPVSFSPHPISSEQFHIPIIFQIKSMWYWSETENEMTPSELARGFANRAGAQSLWETLPSDCSGECALPSYRARVFKPFSRSQRRLVLFFSVFWHLDIPGYPPFDRTRNRGI